MDPLLNLLHQSIGSTGCADAETIKQNIQASRSMESDIVSAIEARVRQQALRAEYRNFCEDIKHDLDPIEAEYGGCPTFNEWVEEYRNDK